jgi:hypothetical protein
MIQDQTMPMPTVDGLTFDQTTLSELRHSVGENEH